MRLVRRETKAAAADKSSPEGNHEGRQAGRQGGSGNQEQPRREIMKGDKLGRQGTKSSPAGNHEGRQAWDSGSQEQPRREIMKGDKLGRQGSSGITTIRRFRKSATQSLRSKNPIASSYLGKNTINKKV